MLFGMFKEKEIIESANFDTTKGDIVEDFGGINNNQNSSNNLVSLSSFSGSHSEDINYQSIDLNNPQAVINSINGNNLGKANLMPTNSQTNYSQNQSTPSNNPQQVFQNYNSMANINTNPIQNPQQVFTSYNPMSNTNVNTIQQIYPNIYQNPSIQSNNQNIPVNNMEVNQQNNNYIKAEPNINQKVNNTSNIENNIQKSTPVLESAKLMNENTTAFDSTTNPNLEPSVNVSNTITKQKQDLENTYKINNIESDTSNAPVEILTSVPEKQGITNLTSTLLGSPNTNMPSFENTSIANIQEVQTANSNDQEALNNNIEQFKNNFENTNIITQPINNIELENNYIPSQETIAEVPIRENTNNMNSAVLDLSTNQNIVPLINVVEPIENNINAIVTNDIINNPIQPNMAKSIDEEIKKSPIPSIIPTIPEINNENINIEQPISTNVDIVSSVKPLEENLPDLRQNVQEHEHKFIINDNVDVEQGFKICPKCGQKIRDDYRLCFVCGTYF